MNMFEVEQFLTQYKEEMELTDSWLKERMNEVRNNHQFDPSSEELIFGARVAWRNSNRCIGRLFWKSLHVFDERDLEDERNI
ncbi:Nitric oxide synthase oxygenase OS=Ureibacillus acetophenoni OX=614649 GN=SAMN05877842_11282 PE=3 SV=1 [Ureibacillus acetophenoni]